MKKYVTIRRSRGLCAEVEKPISLQELQFFLFQEEAVDWGFDPITSNGVIEIENSDGSLGMYTPPEGFFLREDNKSVFFQCYEYDRGIVIHLHDSKTVRDLADTLAYKLDANVFESN